MKKDTRIGCLLGVLSLVAYIISLYAAWIHSIPGVIIAVFLNILIAIVNLQ